VKTPDNSPEYPSSIHSLAQKALYDNLNSNEALANELHSAINQTRNADWRSHLIRSRAVYNCIKDILKQYDIIDSDEIHRIYELVKNQKEY
jgi:type I restriction enzyme R subunit